MERLRVGDARMIVLNRDDMMNTNIALTIREISSDVPIVAFVDNDPVKVGTPLFNPSIIGTLDDIPAIVRRSGKSTEDGVHRGRVQMGDYLQDFPLLSHGVQCKSPVISAGM